MFHHINAQQVFDMLPESDTILVDNRDGQSFAQGHISGAFHLTNDTLGHFIETVNKDKKIIVCCYHGNSSQQVAEYLNQQGYSTVFSLDGGFENWRLHYPYDSIK